MINDFNIFIFNSLLEANSNGELEIYYSYRLRNLLKSINDNISEKLLLAEKTDSFKTKRLFIDCDDTDPKRITFLMINKVKDVFNEEESEYVLNHYLTAPYDYYVIPALNSRLRGSIGINQFVNEVFNNEYITIPLSDEKKLYNREHGIKTKGQELEEFVNKFKSYRTPGKFELVNGEDIIYWYNQTNYVNGNGELNSSCMRYEFCGLYINFYALNPQSVSLLIMRDKDETGKIIGRALVWNLSLPSGRVFMDRIYTKNQSDVELFKNYAKENGWLYKRSQNMSENEFIIDSTTDKKERMTLKVDNINNLGDYEFPYMDTFKYLYTNENNGTLTNDINVLPIKDYSIYKLENTDGGFYGGKTLDELKDDIVDTIIDNIMDFVYENDINDYGFWDYVDDDKFIENYKKIRQKELLVSFDTSFDIEKIKSILKVIQPEYYEKIKNMNELTIKENLTIEMKDYILKYHLDNYYNGLTAEIIFEKYMNKKLTDLKPTEFYFMLSNAFDEEGFAESIANNMTISKILSF